MRPTHVRVFSTGLKTRSHFDRFNCVCKLHALGKRGKFANDNYGSYHDLYIMVYYYLIYMIYVLQVIRVGQVSHSKIPRKVENTTQSLLCALILFEMVQNHCLDVFSASRACTTFFLNETILCQQIQKNLTLYIILYVGFIPHTALFIFFMDFIDLGRIAEKLFYKKL